MAIGGGQCQIRSGDNCQQMRGTFSSFLKAISRGEWPEVMQS